MKIDIKFLGGCGEVGRSAILVDDLLLDYGMKPSDPPQFPLNGIRPESVIVSHAHIDHCGIVPNLVDLDPDIIMTPPTRDISHFLGKDTIKIGRSQGILPFIDEDLKRYWEMTRILQYKEEVHSAGYEVKLYDAGHIPGSSCIYLEGEKRLFYTGDINTSDTRLLNKADLNFPETDILIIGGGGAGTGFSYLARPSRSIILKVALSPLSPSPLLNLARGRGNFFFKEASPLRPQFIRLFLLGFLLLPLLLPGLLHILSALGAHFSSSC